MVRSTLWMAVCLFFLTNVAAIGNAQSFDEDFHLWPVDLKVNGTIVAGGGGELPDGAYELFARAAAKEDSNPIVVHLMGGEGDRELHPELEKIEGVVKLSIASEKDELATETEKAIKESRAIWITTENQLGKRQSVLLRAVLKAVTHSIGEGATLCVNGVAAESAGAIISEAVGELSAVKAGVNLFPDCVIRSSYDDEQHRQEILGAIAPNPRYVGLGIEKNTAVVLRGRKMFVMGEGQATFCLMANEQKPLRIQHVKQAKRRANPYETIVDLTAWRRDAIERTVEPFPPAKPPIPLVESGTLLIVGGGGMPSGLMEQMVELAGGKNAKMVYVPCSESDVVEGPQPMVEAWKKMGVESATFIHTKDRIRANSDEAFLAPLKNATGIWFGGGRQWNFSDSYYGTKAHMLMKDVLKRGGVIGGSSAGASIQARYMCRANPVANFDIMAPGYERGLGFIGGVAIDQHFSQRGRQKDMTQLVNRYPQLLGIGLDEATAIIVQKSIAKVVGKGKVHFYDRNLPVVPGEDDFIALEDGTTFDLKSRKIVEDESK